MDKLFILIVEDEVIVAEDLAHKVQQLGYDVVGTTATGEEAVDMARRHKPALVLMDIHLAGFMDGIVAAEIIQRECNQPVLFLTAHSDPGTVMQARQAGAFGYILKPIEIHDLRIQIEMALYKHAAERRLREHEKRLAGINRILRAALTCETEEDLGAVCLNIAEEITQSRFGFIGEIKEDGFQDIAISNPGWEACNIIAPRGHRKPPGTFKIHGIYGRVILDGKSLFTNDPGTHPDSIGLPEKHPLLTSFLGVPLMHGGNVTGLLAVGNREGGYTQTEQAALEALTPSIVEAFTRKRAEAALRKSEEQLQVLNQNLKHTISQLEGANQELVAFAYSISHDLRAPLRAMGCFSEALMEDFGDKMEGEAREYLNEIITGSRHMGQLIDGLLTLSRSTRGELRRDWVDLSEMADHIRFKLEQSEPHRRVHWRIEPGLSAHGDTRMIEVVMRNLLDNAWKYTANCPEPIIRVYAEREGNERIVCVADNGAGFDMAHAEKLFQPFQRLHRQDEFPGIGVGLATVQRIVHRHGGTIKAAGAPNKGAIFQFSLPNGEEHSREPQ